MTNHTFKKLVLFLGDTICYFASIAIMVYLWKNFHFSEEVFIRHAKAFSYLYILWFLVFQIENFYNLQNIKQNKIFSSCARITILGSIVSVFFFYVFSGLGITPKTNLVIFSGTYLVILYLWRYLYLRVISREALMRGILLLGENHLIDLIKQEIISKDHLGYKILNKGEVTDISKTINDNIDAINTIVMDKEIAESDYFKDNLYSLMAKNIRLMDLNTFIEEITEKIPVRNLKNSWFLTLKENRFDNSYHLFKNISDKIFSIILLLLFIPVFVILIPVLLLTTGWPIFFVQRRTGFLNKDFNLFKLRTMVINAEKSGAQWATPSDVRITPIGKFLRKSRFDEVPQLINVLKGDMSLVGPRPERPEFVEKLKQNIPYYNERHLTKPGLTGWAQIKFRYGFSEDDSLEKLQYDLYYIKHQSFLMDAQVILQTIKTVLTGVGH